MRKTALIGHSGFVGSQLLNQFKFGELFNSTNIHTIQGQTFELIVCAGVQAVKWWANQHPQEDRAKINNLLDKLKTVSAQAFVLISTVDVYPQTTGVDETFACKSKPNHAYGAHRLYVEETVQTLFPQTTIIRLPGLFGPGLKKNVIHDLLHDDCLDVINPASTFQWYYLNNLWHDIEIARAQQLKLVNLVTEPIETADIIKLFFSHKQTGICKGPLINYNIRTCYDYMFNGKNGYIHDKDTVLAQIGQFIKFPANQTHYDQ